MKVKGFFCQTPLTYKTNRAFPCIIFLKKNYMLNFIKYIRFDGDTVII